MPLQFRNAKRWITKRVTPDYTNQLDLFSEAAPETSAPVVTAPVRTSGLQGRPRAPEQLRFDEWVPLPPEDAPKAPAPKPAPASTGAHGRALPEPDQRPDTGVQDGISKDSGTSDRPDLSAERVLDIEPEAKPSRDFRITSAHRIGQGSPHEKARDNIATIRLLKTLEAENREASGDEKAILARYVGWGSMPNVFGYALPGEWQSVSRAVKELLTGPEVESARASTPNAHFTSPLLIEAIWNGLQQFGLREGAQVLESAMGVGHFFGFMPESMQGGHPERGAGNAMFFVFDLLSSSQAGRQFTFLDPQTRFRKGSATSAAVGLTTSARGTLFAHRA